MLERRVRCARLWRGTICLDALLQYTGYDGAVGQQCCSFHSWRYERHCNIAAGIDYDHATRSPEVAYFDESRARGLLYCLVQPAYSMRDLHCGGCPDKVLALPRTRDSDLAVCPVTRANERRISTAPG